jgi:hypothetical protein
MTEKLYNDGTYLANNQSWHANDSQWKANKILAMLEKNHINPKSVSEVGCGAGEILISLSQHFKDTEFFKGYDISQQAYEICSQKENDRIKFELNDITQLEVYFDLIMAIDVFEHIEDYIGFLKSFKEKGLYKIFHIPLDLSAQTVLRSKPIIYSRKKMGHLHYFNKDTALATLKDLGYEILDYKFTKWSLERPNNNILSKFASIPRWFLHQINEELAANLLGGCSLLVLAK